MTTGPLQPSSPIGAAHEPAWVRRGSPRTQQDYRTAVAFETALLEQLTRSMSQAAGMGEGGEEGEEGTGTAQVPGPIAAMVPQALASGIARGGGLGLAAEITRAEEGVPAGHGAAPNPPAASAVGGEQGPGTGPAAGGTAAPAGAAG